MNRKNQSDAETIDCIDIADLDTVTGGDLAYVPTNPSAKRGGDPWTGLRSLIEQHKNKLVDTTDYETRPNT